MAATTYSLLKTMQAAPGNVWPTSTPSLATWAHWGRLESIAGLVYITICVKAPFSASTASTGCVCS